MQSADDQDAASHDSIEEVQQLPQSVEQAAALAEKLARLELLESHFADAVQQAKLDAMKELAYGAGHELNNPLANISTRAQVLLRDEQDPERRRKLAAINAQAFRGHEMIADLMLFARPPKMSPEQIDLAALLTQVIHESQPMAEERQIEVVLAVQEEGLSLHGDKNQLTVALSAMVKNAIEVLGVGGRIELESRATSDTEGEWAEILIRDNGPGIEPHILPHIFDPFYSGREAGRGLGFGLSKAWRIITRHDGTIVVDSQPGHGTAFTLRLPIDSGQIAATSSACD